MKKKIIATILTATLLSTTSYLAVFADNENVITDKNQVELAEQRAKKDEQKRKKDINLKIFIDGQELTFTEEENLGMPFIDENKRTLVPLRKPVEMTGSTISWDNNTKTATILTKEQAVNTYDAHKGQKGTQQKIVNIKAGDKYMTWRYKDEIKMNEKIKEMDTKAIIKDSRTYIPLRAVLEMIGYTVSYNKDTRTITATNAILKTWSGIQEIEKDFPNLINDIKKLDSIPKTVIIDTLVLDNFYKDKMKVGVGDLNAKWISLNTPTRDYMIFIKDNKAVFDTDGFLDNLYYYRYHDTSVKDDGTFKNDDSDLTYQGNIQDVDYMLLYNTFNPVATLIENPFKDMTDEEMFEKGLMFKKIR